LGVGARCAAAVQTRASAVVPNFRNRQKQQFEDGGDFISAVKINKKADRTAPGAKPKRRESAESWNG
jgi:hypothetical protein